MTRDEFISRVADRAGLPDLDAAERVSCAVLEGLGECLSRLESEALAEDVPPPMGPCLRRGRHGQGFGLDELQARISAREAARMAIAVEHVVVVLQVLAEALRGDVLARVRRELPPDIGALLTAPEPVEPPPAVHLRPERRTLAEGRPGGSHPLYEASADRGHSQSVARADNPHGDTKLSSARGLTQEREDETLATGRPGSSRPLSEAPPKR